MSNYINNVRQRLVDNTAKLGIKRQGPILKTLKILQNHSVAIRLSQANNIITETGWANSASALVFEACIEGVRIAKISDPNKEEELKPREDLLIGFEKADTNALLYNLAQGIAKGFVSLKPPKHSLRAPLSIQALSFGLLNTGLTMASLPIAKDQIPLLSHIKTRNNTIIMPNENERTHYKISDKKAAYDIYVDSFGYGFSTKTEPDERMGSSVQNAYVSTVLDLCPEEPSVCARLMSATSGADLKFRSKENRSRIAYFIYSGTSPLTTELIENTLEEAAKSNFVLCGINPAIRHLMPTSLNIQDQIDTVRLLTKNCPNNRTQHRIWIDIGMLRGLLTSWE